MITTPEEYFRYLWGIEAQEPLLDAQGNPVIDENGNVVMTGVNPYNNKPIYSIILPSDERTFDVDLSARTIYVPTFLSVQRDHQAETVYFLVDRYYEHKDLANTSCMVEFINANGEGGYYPVPFYDISTYKADDKMLIPWCIDGTVTRAAGDVSFALRFYQLDDSNAKFVYNIRTQVAHAQVLEGLDESQIEKDLGEGPMSTLAQMLLERMDRVETTIYWTDLDPYNDWHQTEANVNPDQSSQDYNNML